MDVEQRGLFGPDLPLYFRPTPTSRCGHGEDAHRHHVVATEVAIDEQAGGPRRVELEARVLAGEVPKMIALRIGVTAEVVKSYESLYFNFRDQLQALDFIITFAIRKPGPSIRQTSPAEAFVRWLGYGAGGVALDEVAPLLPTILSWDDPERLRDPVDVNNFEGMLMLRLRVLFRVQAIEMSGPLGGLATKNLQEVQEVKDHLATDIQTLAAAENQQNEDRVEDRVVDDRIDVYQQAEQEIIIFAE